MTRRASVAAPSEPVSIQIIVPGSPTALLAPNRRAHGYAKADATRQHRRDAWGAALDELASTVPDDVLFHGPVSVEAHICWAPRERVHDLDSCAVMVKPFLDGLTDAHVWRDDSQMKRLTVSQEAYRVNKTNGQVVIKVTAIQEGSQAA